MNELRLEAQDLNRQAALLLKAGNPEAAKAKLNKAIIRGSDMNKEPNYVLKTQENIRMKKNKKLFWNGSTFVPFPIELHFYDDMIEIHRMEVHYSNGKVRRELHRFFLAINPQITYDYRNKYVTIKGLAYGEWYLYSKKGELNSKPERVSDTQGICYVYVADSNLDIVKEIEERSTLKVNRVNV